MDGEDVAQTTRAPRQAVTWLVRSTRSLIMPSVVVVGGGIAGLATGMAFQKADWDVQVLERAPSIEPMGAALSLWPNACAALSELGAFDAVAQAAAPIRAMQLATKEGRRLFYHTVDGPALLATRSALQNTLASLLRDNALKVNCRVERIEDQAIRLADGTFLSPDLIVDAGGIRSVGNDNAEPSYAGYGGVLALTDPVDGPSLNGLAAEYWGKQERFGVFELPGNRRYWFYMRTQPADAAMPTLGECIERASDWPTNVRLAVQATAQDSLIPFSVYANPPPTSLIDGKVVRVGDAAHAMEPNQGQGACQGIEDAVALASLATRCEVSALPSAYEAMRLKRARMFVRESARARLGIHGSTIGQHFFRTGLRAMPAWVSNLMIKRMQTLPDYSFQIC